MLRTHISLAGIIFLAVFFETVFVPGIWNALRVDLFIGMIIGVMIHLGFSQGLTFVLVTSLFLQAFSGARPGLVPMIYLGIFLVVCLLKGIIYMENILTQLILAGVLSILVATGAGYLFGSEPEPGRACLDGGRRSAYRHGKSIYGCPCR